MKRLLTIAVIILTGIAAWAIFPSLVPAEKLRVSLEQKITEIAGRDVKLESAERLSIRPYLGATYKKVRFGNIEDAPPFFDVEEIRVQYDFGSVLAGSPTIKNLQLIRPKLNWKTPSSKTQSWTEALKLNDEALVGSLKDIKIVGGILTWQNPLETNQEEVTSLNGFLKRSGAGTGAQTSFAGIWNGEAVSMEGGLSSLSDLLDANPTQANILIKSAPLRVLYEGQIALQPSIALKGKIDVSTQSAFQASQWLRKPLPALGLTNDLQLQGDIESTSGRLKVQNATATVGSAIGRGSLQFTTKNSILSVEGTLAFDEVILPQLYELGRFQEADNSKNDSISDGLAMDVRLSASKASSGPFVMEALAASVFIKDGKTLLDVAQAQTLGGQVVGTFRPSTDRTRGFSADLTLTDVDLLQLTQLYGTTNIAVEGRGNARLKLDSNATGKESLLKRLNGSASLVGKNGILKGVNIDAISSSLDAQEKIEGASVFDGQTEFDAIDLNLFIANGVAFLQKTKLVKGDDEVTLAGRSDLDARSLALQGRVIRLKEKNEDSDVVPRTSLPFMVGGTAKRPLFIALPNRFENAGPPNEIPEIKATD